MKSEIHIGKAKKKLTDLTMEEREVFGMTNTSLTALKTILNGYLNEIPNPTLQAAFLVTVTTSLLGDVLEMIENDNEGVPEDRLLQFRRLAIEKLERGLKK